MGNSNGRNLIKGHEDSWRLALKFGDMLVIIAAWLIACFIRTGDIEGSTAQQFALLITLLLMTMIFPLFSLYHSRRGRDIRSEVRMTVYAWLLISLLVVGIAYITKTSHLFSRLWWMIWISNGALLLILYRASLRALLKRLRKNGYNIRNAIIIGSGNLGRFVAGRIKDSELAGINVIGVFDDDLSADQEIEGIPVLGSIEQAIALIKSGNVNSIESEALIANELAMKLRNIDHIFIVLPLAKENRIRNILDSIDQSTATVHYVPDFFGHQLLNQSIDEFAGVPLISLNDSPMDGSNLWIKSTFDRLVACALMAVLAPVLLLIALAIKLDSSGPLIFKQRRYGLDGREFVVWKFRSMTVCEDNSKKLFQATVNDPRVTRVGRILRKTSLDELPQLFNVLEGTMSLVGPRPHAVAHNEEYKSLIKGYMWRHKVKPGITGLAQVNGWRGETDVLEKMEKRVEYDLKYINSWSMWLDVKILFKTLITVPFQKNAH